MSAALSAQRSGSSVTQSAVSQRLRSLEAQVGQLLVVRSRPLRLTETGRCCCASHAATGAAQRCRTRTGARVTQHERIAIAVNADSLATWVLPALDALARRGIGLELVVDDQDFTHDWLREGEVLGCVSTVRQALRGCELRPLG